ncbi:MAG: DUF4097 family beta strand repeat-containing protein, partial [Kineosporiaceae bacterium]
PVPPQPPPAGGDPGGHAGRGGAGPRRGWPWWAVVLTVLGAAVVVAAVAVAVVLTVAAAATQEDAGRIEAGDVREVEITAEVGSVTLDATGDRSGVSGVSGEWRVRTAFGRGEVESDVADGVLRLSHECPEPSFGRCQLDLDLALPADTVVRVRTGVGEVIARGLAGPVDARSEAGSVHLRDLTAARVRAEVGIGDVDLGFTEAPRDVVARADVGDVEVRVPDDGTVYAVTTSSDVGDDSADVPTDPAAARTLVATVEVGDARVRASG